MTHGPLLSVMAASISLHSPTHQATYTTARLGLFNNFSTMLKEYNGGQVRVTRASVAAAHLSSHNIVTLASAARRAP